MVFRLLLIFCFLLPWKSIAQTGGGGQLSSIESKANEIANLEKRIQTLQHEIPKLQLEKDLLIESARKGLADMLDKIENDQSWKNRRESARSGWEENNPGTCSAGGPPPICVADHWHRVPSNVAWAKYLEYRDGVLEEYHEKIRNAGKEQDSKIVEANHNIQEAHGDIDRLRREIIALSREYRERVIEAGKSRQRSPIMQLMKLVAEKHNLEDRVDIYNVRLKDLNQDETKMLAEVREKVARQADEEKKNLEQKINENETRMSQLEKAHMERTALLYGQVQDWTTELRDIHLLLQDTSRLEKGQYQPLVSRKQELDSRIQEGQNQLREFKSQFDQVSLEIKTTNKAMSDKIWDYTVNLSKVQDEAVAAVKEAYTSKRQILNEGKAARTAALRSMGSRLADRSETEKRKFLDWTALIDQERVRLLRACQLAGCQCFGSDTQGQVVLNWNNSFDCVSKVDFSRRSASAIYGCAEESDVYSQYYASLQGSLSDSDQAALKRATTRTRLDMIYNKIIE